MSRQIIHVTPAAEICAAQKSRLPPGTAMHQHAEQLLGSTLFQSRSRMVTSAELDGDMVHMDMQHTPTDDCAWPSGAFSGAPRLFPICRGLHHGHVCQQPASCHTHGMPHSLALSTFRDISTGRGIADSTLQQQAPHEQRSLLQSSVHLCCL